MVPPFLILDLVIALDNLWMTLFGVTVRKAGAVPRPFLKNRRDGRGVVPSVFSDLKLIFKMSLKQKIHIFLYFLLEQNKLSSYCILYLSSMQVSFNH